MKKTTIGGQAVIEGVMMKGPSKIAVAVRKPDNEIELKVEDNNSITKKYKFLKLPFLRGVVSLIEALNTGISTLMYSASFWTEDEEEEDFSATGVILTSFALAIVFFMILPSVLASFMVKFTQNTVVLNLIEGAFRLTIFFIYLYFVSKVEDIKRVFEYHGAEHKSINCYEHEEELTVENVKKYSRLHKRCGTSFLFNVMVISIIVLSFFGWPNPIVRVISRILLFPVIAGITYEFNRLVGRYDNPLTDFLSYPGLMMQKLVTVKEPDESQIEVAIKALESVLPQAGEDDNW